LLGGPPRESAAALALCHTGTVSFAPLPATACWEHRAARSGFEVAYFQAAPGGWRMDGTTAAVEDGQTWIVSYSIRLDAAWFTREARITSRTASGSRETLLACDGESRWRIDGRPAAHLDGCLDVDLESSALTNTLYIWHYNTDFGHYLMPFPDMRQLPTTITLSAPVDGKFTKMVEARNGSSTTYTYPAKWAEGAS